MHTIILKLFIKYDASIRFTSVFNNAVLDFHYYNDGYYNL